MSSSNSNEVVLSTTEYGVSPGLDLVEKATEVMNGMQSELDALVGSTDAMRMALEQHEMHAHKLFKNITSIQKLHARLISKLKKPKRKGGFAFPISVSDEMCEFMKVPIGTLVSRTAFSKRLPVYAREHNLIQKGSIIELDSVLASLFGKTSADCPISFIMAQKYATHHFKGPVATIP